MKKRKILCLILLFVGMFIIQHDLVNADTFIARFFPGQGGYLKYNGSYIDQGFRVIDSEIGTTLTNYYKRDDCSFAGWVAEYNNGEVWYCKEGIEASNCGKDNNYELYSATKAKMRETGQDGGNAGFHAVWNCSGELIYPEEMGKGQYNFFDVDYYSEKATSDNDINNPIGRQSMIYNQENRIMSYTSSESDGTWSAGYSDDDKTVTWYCADDSESTNCSSKKVYKADSKPKTTAEAGKNHAVFKANPKKNIKTNYYYLVYESLDNDNTSYEVVKAYFDSEVTLDPEMFEYDDYTISGWDLYLKVFKPNTGTYEDYCYDPDKNDEDYNQRFSALNCRGKNIKKVGRYYKFNITSGDANYNFNNGTFYNSIYCNTSGKCYSPALYVRAIWSSDKPSYSSADVCKRENKVWIKRGDKGYCSIDGLLYLSCGDVDGIPEFVPRIASYAVTLLKTVAPIVLIIISVITLVKAMTAGKEEDIKKAQTSLVKKLIIGAIIFFVVTIVQFVILKVADSSEKNNLSKCLSCFLNGTKDSSCNSLYYKDRDSVGNIEKKEI